MAGRRRAVLVAGAEYRGETFPPWPFAVTTVHNRTLAATASDDGTVRLWDLSPARLVSVLTTGAGLANALAFVGVEGDRPLLGCGTSEAFWWVGTSTSADR